MAAIPAPEATYTRATVCQMGRRPAGRPACQLAERAAERTSGRSSAQANVRWADERACRRPAGQASGRAGGGADERMIEWAREQMFPQQSLIVHMSSFELIFVCPLLVCPL